MSIRRFKKLSTKIVRVPIILPTGETEILIKNLDTSFTINDLAELYRLRWGIETCFFCIKSFQMLGTFSGYSQLAVKQDIYVNLLFYNLQTIAQLEAEKKVKMLSIRRKSKANKNRKAENLGYQINRNIGTNTLRSHLFELFTCPNAIIVANIPINATLAFIIKNLCLFLKKPEKHSFSQK